MITPQLSLGLHDEIFVDNFAGGGGASTGIELALGRPVDAALNHNRVALAMHRMNHPQTRHYCEDIRHADPLKICGQRRVGGIWFSPDCKHFSKAKGGKPRDKRIRGLAWSVVHWVNVLRRRPAGAPRVILLENVEEFQTWCPLQPDGTPSKWRAGWFFDCFVGALRRRGAVVEWRELRACDYGTPTIRKRLFLIARFDGAPITWPEPTHVAPQLARRAKLPAWRTIAECLDWSLPCPSIFLSREEARAVKANRPLAKATLARVAKGVDRYVLRAKQPFIVATPALAPFLTEHANASSQRNMPADEPARTVCGEVKGGHFAVVAPYLVPRYGERRGQEPRTRSVETPAPVIVPTQNGGSLAAVHLTKFRANSIGSGVDAPAPTITANSFVKRPGGAAPLGVVAASMVKLRGDPASHSPGYSPDQPAHTISAQGTHHGVVAAYVAQHNGGMVGHQAAAPASTISSKGSQQQVVAASLLKYYSTDQDPRMDEPAHTVTTRDRFGFSACTGAVPPFTPEMEAGARRVAAFLRAHGVQFEGEFAMVGEYVIVDIGMRMLRPRELYLAQGFPGGYIIDRGLDEDPETGRLAEIRLTGTEQVRMCGNSVCPPLARALVAANLPELCREALAA